MQCAFKTTVRFPGNNGNEWRLDYLVSAMSSADAERALKARLTYHEVFGYSVEGVRPATCEEVGTANLPLNCVMLLG
jgi:hypothetical protein